jgi:hypothetical protein
MSSGISYKCEQDPDYRQTTSKPLADGKADIGA